MEMLKWFLAPQHLHFQIITYIASSHGFCHFTDQNIRVQATNALDSAEKENYVGCLLHSEIFYNANV